MTSEEEALERLLRKLGRVSELQAELRTERYLVQDRSPLAGDRRKLHGYPADHFVSRYLESACENLDALRRLIVDAEVFHPTAPFTLIRTAIELGAWSCWLLAPESRPERIRRIVAVAFEEERTANQARQGDGNWLESLESLEPGTVDPELAAELARFRVESEDRLRAQRMKFAEALESVGLPSLKMPSRKITGAFEDLADVVPEALVCLSQWRLTSGMVHGRFWPRMSVNDWDEEVVGTEGDRLVRLTASYKGADLATGAALLLIAKAMELLRLRGAAPY